MSISETDCVINCVIHPVDSVIKISKNLALIGYFNFFSTHVREFVFRNPRLFCFRNTESGKFLLVKSEILGFGI